MYKKNLFSLVFFAFLSSNLISLAQNPSMDMQLPHSGANPSGIALPQNVPPIILIAGKEKESFQKVFIEKIKAGSEINLKLLMFDREQAEEIKINSYGLPELARLDIKKDEKMKNHAEANLSWKPEKSDKGFHTIVIEVKNSKNAVSRVSLSYDVL